MVNAIEVKDRRSVREGIGQALTYKRGANFVYLAAPQDAITPLKEDILAHGIGVIEVSKNQEWFLSVPPFLSSPIYLRDVLRELELLQSGEPYISRVTSLDLNHPINYIAPVLFFDNKCSDFETINIRIKEWGMNRPEKNLRGARIFGLIKKAEERLFLTPDGINLKRLLKRIYDRPLNQLKELKKNEPLFELDAELAYLIKFYYLRNPDVRIFVNILNVIDCRRPTIYDILENSLELSPNLIIHFMLRRTRKKQVLRMFQNNTREEIRRELRTSVFVRGNLLKSLFFPFKRQLIHIGILKPTRIWSGGLETIDFDDDYWILKKNLQSN